MDCTGCQLCVHVCPDNALVDKPLNSVMAIEDTNWSFATALPERIDVMDRASVKGSQFMKPLLEVCCEMISRCGEPQVRVLRWGIPGESTSGVWAWTVARIPGRSTYGV